MVEVMSYHHKNRRWGMSPSKIVTFALALSVVVIWIAILAGRPW